MFDAGNTRMIGLPYGKKLRLYVKPFSSDTGMLRTDRQTERHTNRRTDLLYQYRASVWDHVMVFLRPSVVYGNRQRLLLKCLIFRHTKI